MIEFLFLDLDDTILDFQKAEHIAIRKTLRHFGLEPEETVLARYTAINIAHWQNAGTERADSGRSGSRSFSSAFPGV